MGSARLFSSARKSLVVERNSKRTLFEKRRFYWSLLLSLALVLSSAGVNRLIKTAGATSISFLLLLPGLLVATGGYFNPEGSGQEGGMLLALVSNVIIYWALAYVVLTLLHYCREDVQP